MIWQGAQLVAELPSKYIVTELVQNPDAHVVTHNAPTTIQDGNSYTIDITVKNTSDSTWSEDDQVRLCIWQDGIDHGYRLMIPEGVTIAPGETYTFTLEGFVAPPADTTYLEFQMLQEGITYFGEKERVDITVQT